jgi:very-short-patch-repair endonuclease
MGFDPMVPFLSSEVRGTHLSDWQLRPPRYTQLFRGVWIDSRVPLTTLLRGRAALLVTAPGSALSHHTAAELWGAVVPHESDIHVTSRSRGSRKEGIVGHVARPGTMAMRFRGVPLTTPAQTFTDLRALTLVDLVVLGDSLVRKERVTPDRLCAAAAGVGGRAGQHLTRAASLVRAEVDSAMETRLRLLMVLAGLPEPTVNHKITRPDGSVRFRFDLSYPEYRLAIEYDGRQHAESEEQWGWDLDRREWIDDNKWRIVVNRSGDLYSTPARTLRRLTEAMRARGMTVPRLSNEWRRHFLSRPWDEALPA